MKTCISGMIKHNTIKKNNMTVFAMTPISLVKLLFITKWIKLIHPLKSMAIPPDKNHITSAADVSSERSKSGYSRCAIAKIKTNPVKIL